MQMIRYVYTVDNVKVEQLQGFFVGWPNPLSPKTHLDLLHNSDEVVLALDEGIGRIVGFITAITDNVLSAYIPLLEVLPSHQHQGIGSELVRRMLTRLSHFYMIDLLCDLQLQSFYAASGMQPASGMLIRNRQHQAGQLL